MIYKNIAGQDRIGAGKLLDRTMQAISKGEQVDIDTWVKELGIENAFTRAESTVAKNVQRQAEYNAIEVTSAELGIDDSAPLKAFITKAREFYQVFKGKPIYHPDERMGKIYLTDKSDMGKISFTRKGMDKSVSTGPDKRKWKLVPKLQEIIVNAEYKNTKASDKARKDGIIAFHWLESDVVLDGELLRVGIQIGENAKGKLFYNINQDLVRYRTKKESSKGLPCAKMYGPIEELNQDANASNELNISDVADNVNMEILLDVNRLGGKDLALQRKTLNFSVAKKEAIIEMTGESIATETQILTNKMTSVEGNKLVEEGYAFDDELKEIADADADIMEMNIAEESALENLEYIISGVK